MYFEKARGNRNEWWRYLVTLLPAFFAYLVIGVIPLYVFILINMANGVPIDIIAFTKTSDPAALGLSQNTGFILLLIPSVLAFFVLAFTIIRVHKTSLGKIASASGKIRWGRLFRAALLWLALLVSAELIFALIEPSNYSFQFDIKAFIPLLIISLLFLPFQTWFEELMFRAYLMQGIAYLFRLRIVALLITSVAFGMLHVLNPEVNEFGLWATMPYYIGFGLFAGLLVIYDNGIEMACGVHAINNIYSAVLVTYNSSVLKTPAVWRIENIDPWYMSIAFVVMAGIFFIIMARGYKWGDWNKIFRLIPHLSQNTETR